MADRYVRHAPPAPLTVTATAAATGGQITVTDTARAGSTVVISAGEATGSGDTTAVVSAGVGQDGHFRAASASRELWRHARSNVLVVNPDAPDGVPAEDLWRELAND